MSVIWISGVLLSFPMGYTMEVIYVKEENNKPFCYPTRLNERTMHIFRTILVFLQYVMPLCVIIWAYWNISVALWGNTAPGNAQTDRDANLMRNKKRVSVGKRVKYINCRSNDFRFIQIWVLLGRRKESIPVSVLVSWACIFQFLFIFCVSSGP